MEYLDTLLVLIALAWSIAALKISLQNHYILKRLQDDTNEAHERIDTFTARKREARENES